MTLYGDGAVKATMTLTNNEPRRLPGGWRAKEFEVMLEGTAPVDQIGIWDSMGDVT
jgi:hypothetical protein